VNDDDGAVAPVSWPDAADPRALHLDVRGLPRPQPLIQILQLLQRLPDDAVLVVHHERDPLWLYPELLQIGWWAEVVDGDPGEVRLRIARA
jgi:hypothetical protein